MLRVYFVAEIEKEEKFSKETKRTKDGPIDEFRFHGIRVSLQETGEWMTYGFDRGDVVPEGAAKFISRVTDIDNFPAYPSRELGKYKMADAEANLNMVNGGERPHLHVRLSGKSVDGLYQLLDAIRIGTIRPYESFEGEQIGKSMREIERDVRALRQERDHLETVHLLDRKMNKRIVGELMKLRTLSGALRNLWGALTKKKRT